MGPDRRAHDCLRNRDARWGCGHRPFGALAVGLVALGLLLAAGWLQPADDQPAPADGPAEEPADDADGTATNTELTAELARTHTLETLGKIPWQDKRFQIRTLLEIGGYVAPAPKNPANRIFLLQEKNPQWAGGWVLIRQGAGGSGFALYDETGKAEQPVVLARIEWTEALRAQMTGADSSGTSGHSEVWELVRLAWKPHNRQRFLLYSQPKEAIEPLPVGSLPDALPPLLLRTFPVRASNFGNLDDRPLGIETLRSRLFDPRAASRGPIGKRFMIDDRDNPFGNLNSHDYYASTYDGFLSAPVAGRYRFFLDSDSYGLLLIDAVWPLDADAMAATHGSAWRGTPAALTPAALKRASRATPHRLEFQWRRPLELELTPGLHRITLVHAENTGDQGVRLAWQLPGEEQPHLIAPDSFQPILPVEVLGCQPRAGPDAEAGGGFVSSLQIDLIERVLINGDAHNRMARIRARWRPPPGVPVGADGSGATWRLPGENLLLNAGQPAQTVNFCVPVGAATYFTAAGSDQVGTVGAPVRNLHCALRIPDDLNDQGYLRENVRLAVASETSFAYPGEDWTVHLSAERAYGDLIQPRLHVRLLDRSPAAASFDPAAARLRINGVAARAPHMPGVFSFDLPWNGPTRTPVRLDLDPAALLATVAAATPGGRGPLAEGTNTAPGGREITMQVWIEACGVPLDAASWIFFAQSAENATGAIPATGVLVARRNRLELADAARPAAGTEPVAVPLPPFARLAVGNPHAVLLLGREDPALHRRSIITATVAGLAARNPPDTVLFVGDGLNSRPDLKQIAAAAPRERPVATAVDTTAAPPAGPQRAAWHLAQTSRDKTWLAVPLADVYAANLHPWTVGGQDGSDLFVEAVVPADAPVCVTFAIAAALHGLPPLAGHNGLAVVSLGPRDCANGLAAAQTVRGLDAAIDQLRRLGYPRIVVLGPTPVAGDGNFTTRASEQLSKALATLCQEHAVSYVDAIQELRAVDPALQPLFRAADGERILHTYPQAAGLEQLEKAIRAER